MKYGYGTQIKYDTDTWTWQKPKKVGHGNAGTH